MPWLNELAHCVGYVTLSVVQLLPKPLSFPSGEGDGKVSRARIRAASGGRGFWALGDHANNGAGPS